MSVHILTQPREGTTVQVAFNYKEMEQIILNHVRSKMGFRANKVTIPSSYSSREDYCIVTHDEEVEQVSPNDEPAQPTKRAMEDWP